MLHRVSPEQLTHEDLLLLQRADDAGPAANRLSTAAIVRMLWTGELLLFRASEGALLCEKIDNRLNVIRMAGTQVLHKLPAFLKELQHIARDLCCTVIETDVYSDTLARALARAGMQQQSVCMVLEV